MATSKIFNTVRDASGNPLPNIAVRIRLRPGPSFRASDYGSIAQPITLKTNGSGYWEVNLERNADILPSGSYYECIEDHAPNIKRTFTVGPSDASLYASLIVLLPQPLAADVLTVPTADARYIPKSADSGFVHISGTELLAGAKTGLFIDNGAAVYNAVAAGVDPTGALSATTQTTKLNLAVTNAIAANKKLVIPGGTYNINGLVDFTGLRALDATGAIFVYSGTGTAVRLSCTTTSSDQGRRFILPIIKRSLNAWAAGGAGTYGNAPTNLGLTDVGLELRESEGNYIEIPSVAMFSTNVKIAPTVGGFTGNTVRMGQNLDGFIGLLLAPTGGYVSQNTFLQGNIGMGSAYGFYVPGSRKIKIASATAQVFGNDFKDLTLQGYASELKIECWGQQNTWTNVEMEEGASTMDVTDAVISGTTTITLSAGDITAGKGFNPNCHAGATITGTGIPAGTTLVAGGFGAVNAQGYATTATLSQACSNGSGLTVHVQQRPVVAWRNSGGNAATYNLIERGTNLENIYQILDAGLNISHNSIVHWTAQGSTVQAMHHLGTAIQHGRGDTTLASFSGGGLGYGTGTIKLLALPDYLRDGVGEGAIGAGAYDGVKNPRIKLFADVVNGVFGLYGSWSSSPPPFVIALGNTEYFRIDPNTRKIYVGKSTSDKVALFGTDPVTQRTNTYDLRQGLIDFGFFASGGATPLNLNGGLLTAGSATIAGAVSTGALTASSVASSGAVSGTTGTFSGAVGVASLASSGAVSGTSGTFTGAVAVGSLSSSGALTATTGDFSGLLTASAGLSIADGQDITIAGTTGTKIGQSGSKLAFFGGTPVAQQANSTDLAVVLSNLALRASGGNPPLNLGSGALTAGASTLGATTATSLAIGTVWSVDSSGRIGGGGVTASTSRLLNLLTTHPGSATQLYGILAGVTFPSTTTGFGRSAYLSYATAAASFTMSEGTGLYIDVPTIGASSAVTAGHGIRIQNQGNAGITNSYGIYIAPQSGSSSGNYGLRVDTSTTAAIWVGADASGTAASGGIAYGATRDVKHYRSNSNEFTIDATAGLVLTGGLTLADAKNIAFGTGTGTQLGTSTSQKWAAHGATPVVQRSGAAQAAVATTAATNVAPYGYSQTQADAIVTLLNEIRAALVEKGIIKGSA